MPRDDAGPDLATTAVPAGAPPHDATDDGLDPATSVLDAVARLNRAMFQIGTERLQPWGITLSSYAALRILQRRPHLTLAQLSRRCFVKPQTMTRMVSQLERRGLVERQARATPDRSLSLRLTTTGSTELDKMGDRVERINETIGRVLTPAEVGQLDALLRRLVVEIEADIAQGAPPSS